MKETVGGPAGRVKAPKARYYIHG